VSWALCDAARLQASTGKSVKGRTIYTRDVEPDNARGPHICLEAGMTKAL
jgi:hypothetical protein